MAVTLSCQQVREQVRVVDVFDNMPIRPGVSRPRVLSDAFWMGKFKTAKALVEGYAPKAPSSVQNEACLRAVAWLVDRLAARTMVSRQGYSDNQAPGQISCLRHSGGMALLSPWKIRRGGAV